MATRKFLLKISIKSQKLGDHNIQIYTNPSIIISYYLEGPKIPKALIVPLKFTNDHINANYLNVITYGNCITIGFSMTIILIIALNRIFGVTNCLESHIPVCIYIYIYILLV